MLQNTTTSSYEQNIRPNLANLHARVRAVLRVFDEGMTNKELSIEIGRDASTISGIMRPLVKRGKVYEAGERRCRITGNMAKVWRLVGQPQQPPAPKAETNSLF